MQTFQKTITVSKDDIDELEHVNNVRYVQWIQDIAKDHWQTRASESIRQRYFWMVVEHHIYYKSSAVLNDTILLKTYVTKAEGITSARVVEMYNAKTEKLLVKSETKWCFFDAQTKRPTRIAPEIVELFA